jgi:isopentenyl-diphosphate delta-isomerase
VEQTLIVVDREDRWLGYLERSACHHGDGKLHRAIAALLFDSEGNILLQKRKSFLWDGYWDISGATHLLHLETHDESYEEAAERCVTTEWSIRTPLRRAFAFTYFARFAEYCENEYCVVLTGRHHGKLAYNAGYAYDYRWTDVAACHQEMREAPERFTPWAHQAMRGLRGYRGGN